jgi:hypothetical protein
MTTRLNRSSSSDPLLFRGQERPLPPSSPVTGNDTAEALSSRHVLPTDLNAAIKHLDDQELERLLLAALQERDRRKPPVLEKSERKSQTEIATGALPPRGKLNAIRAAFKAGVAPSRIAQQFGVSRSDVQKALAGYARTR